MVQFLKRIVGKELRIRYLSLLTALCTVSLVCIINAQTIPTEMKGVLKQQTRAVEITINDNLHRPLDIDRIAGSEKLDPAIRVLLNRYDSSGSVGKAAPYIDRHEIFSPYAIHRDEQGQLWVDVFIQTEGMDQSGILNIAHRKRAQRSVTVDNIVSTSVPLQMIPEISALSNVRYVECSLYRDKQKKKAVNECRPCRYSRR